MRRRGRRDRNPSGKQDNNKNGDHETPTEHQHESRQMACSVKLGNFLSADRLGSRSHEMPAPHAATASGAAAPKFSTVVEQHCWGSTGVSTTRTNATPAACLTHV